MSQTTDGLANGGRTAHYQISYDTSLSVDDGLRRAQGLFHECEFDFDLMASWEAGADGANRRIVNPEAPSIFTALEKQLGLKLESTRAAADVLVIDRVEKPTAN